MAAPIQGLALGPSSVSGGGLRARGPPHPMGSLSPLQCVSGHWAAVTRVSMEGAQWVTGGPGRRN